MPIRHSRTACIVALVLAFQTAIAATADEAAVVVTATRFSSAPQDRPIAAQVITADEIRDSSATTVAEVLSKLGGVHTRINATGVPDTPLDLRGFGMTGDQNTLVLINGLRISENEGTPTRLSTLPIDAIERIEILRGSGAVLYGSGATGGTINIITRSPTGGTPTGNVSASVGNHNLRNLRGGLQVGRDNWGMRLNAQHYESDNYRQNNRAEQDAGSGELRFGRRADFVALGFNIDNQKARLPGARTEAQLSSDPRGATTPNDYLNSDSQLYYLRGEKRLGEITLAMDISQRDKELRSVMWGGAPTNTHVGTTMISPRLLWNAQLGAIENRLIAGIDWNDWSYATDLFARDETGTQHNRAFYVRDEMRFQTGTRLSLGARRENVRQAQEERTTPLAKTAVEHHLSAYELALQQELGAGYSAYGRIGRSFRIANIDENRCWAAPCTPLLNPQRSRDREFGVQWRDKGTSFRASLFDMAIDDEIHYMNIGPWLFGSNVNLPPTRHRGLEFEGKLFVSDSLDLAARYTRTQARFRDGIFGGIDVTGKDVPLVPKDRIGMNLGWQVATTTRLIFNVTYVGSQHYDNDQANRFRTMPSYAVADVKLFHDMDAWRLALGINNLFDKAYYSYAIVNGAYTSFNAYPEMRRNAYVSAEYRF
jgi:iron complex outermembrane receptor protein